MDNLHFVKFTRLSQLHLGFPVVHRGIQGAIANCWMSFLCTVDAIAVT